MKNCSTKKGMGKDEDGKIQRNKKSFDTGSSSFSSSYESHEDKRKRTQRGCKSWCMHIKNRSADLLKSPGKSKQPSTVLSEANLKKEFIGPLRFIGPLPMESTYAYKRFEEAGFKVMRENAERRLLQGTSIEGDTEYLAFLNKESMAKKDKHLTKLPPGRKRKGYDEEIEFLKNQEGFQPEFIALYEAEECKALREGALWRHLRGISPLAGDEELLGISKEKPKEGRDDTSLDKSGSAKHKKATDADCRRKSRSLDDADLTDEYELAKWSKSLFAQKHARRHIYRKPAKQSKFSVQKHREERKRPERKTEEVTKREEWEGMHM